MKIIIMCENDKIPHHTAAEQLQRKGGSKFQK